MPFRKIFSITLSLIWLVGLSGCARTRPISTTPVPQPTFPSPPIRYPITNSQDAVNAARRMADTGHFTLIGEVTTNSVQEMSLAEANKLVFPSGDYPYDDRPGDTRVWLVQFYSQIEIQPPPLAGGTTSPTHSLGYGCTYVMFDAAGDRGATVSGGGCPQDSQLPDSQQATPSPP